MSSSAIDISSLFGANPGNSGRQPTAAETAAADQSFAELLGTGDADSDAAKEMLSQITQDGAAGYWAWQVKQMREKAAAEVMSSMNLTPEKIAAMDAKERVETENKIEQLVEQKVKQEIAEESKKKQQQAIVTNASMLSVITNAQSIKDKIEKKHEVVATSDPSNVTDLLLFGAS